MKKNAKRLLAMLLCVVMCVSLLPVPVLAEEGTITAAEQGGTITITEEEPSADESIVPTQEEELEPADETATEAEIVLDTEERGEIFSSEAKGATTASGTCGTDVTWSLSDAGTLTITGSGSMYTHYDEDSMPWRYYRDSIKSVLIQSGVTSIVNGAFANCTSLTRLTIGSGLTNIGEGSFYNCTSLNDISVSSGNLFFSVEDDILFNWNKTSIFLFPAGNPATSYVIPSGVRSIEAFAFSTCRLLTAIDVPESVTSIGRMAFADCTSLISIEIPSGITNIGVGAFRWCTGLTNIEIATDNAYYVTEDGVLFNKEKTTLIQYPAGNPAEGYVIPTGVTLIEIFAFSRSSALKSIVIPESVTNIWDEAFADCTALTSITFEGSAPSFINTDAFLNVTATAYYPEDDDSWTPFMRQNYGGKITWGDEVGVRDRGRCGNQLSWILEDDGTLSIYGTGPMGIIPAYDAPWRNYLSDIKSIVIENGATSIYDWAFNECVNLISVIIPESLTSIGERAFGSCSSLKSITIPKSVTNIGKHAFMGCSSLTSVTFEGDAPTIGYISFYYVTATVYYPAGDVTWTESVRQNYGGDLTWVPVGDVVWEDRTVLEEINLDGGTEDDPLVILVEGSVTANGTVTLNSGWFAIIGTDENSKLIAGENLDGFLLVNNANTTIQNLGFVGETYGAINNNGTLSATNLQINSFSIGIRNNSDSSAEISESTIIGCNTAISGTGMTLTNCEMANNETVFAQIGDSGNYIIKGLRTHGNTNLSGGLSGNYYLEGLVNIAEVFDLSRCALYLTGALEEGSSIKVCNVGENRIVANKYETEEITYEPTDEDAAHFHYILSESEYNGGVLASKAYVNTESNIVVHLKSSIVWEDGDVLEAMDLVGGTEDDPVVIQVRGEVTVNGTVTLKSGYFEIYGTNENSGLVLGENVNTTLLENKANTTIQDLSFIGTYDTTTGSSGISNNGTLNAANLQIANFYIGTTSKRNITINASTITNCNLALTGISMKYVSECTITNCESAISENTTLTNCELANNGAAFLYGSSNMYVIKGLYAHDNAQLFTSYSSTNNGTYYLEGLVETEGVFDLSRCTLYLTGALEEGSSITVCNVKENRIIASNDTAYAYEPTAADAACFHYEPSETEYTGGLVFSKPYVNAAGNIVVNVRNSIVWEDGDVLEEMTLVAGTASDPTVIQVRGTVTLNGPVTLNSGFEIFGTNENSRLIVGENADFFLLVNNADSTIWNLSMVGNAYGAIDNNGTLQAENLQVEDFEVGIRNNAAESTAEISESMLSDCGIALLGSGMTLTNCELADNETMFAWTGESNDTVIKGLKTNGNTNLSDGLNGNYDLEGLVQIEEVFDLSQSTLCLTGSLEEGSGIKVCNVKEDHVIAHKWEADEESYTPTTSDAACFRYEPSESEENSNLVFSAPYVEEESGNIVVNVSVHTHTLEEHAAVAATCEENGNTAYWSCAECGKFFSDAEGTQRIEENSWVIPALGHDLVHHEAKAPSCTEIGWEAYDTCSRCDYTTYAEIPATGHTAGVAVIENKVDPTCTEAGSYDEAVYCTVCGEELSRTKVTVEALGHDYTETVTAPTCTEQGYTTHTCSRCGDSYVDTYVDALGHDWGAWTVTTAPTCTLEGEKTRTCSRCGATETRVVEALGHAWGEPVWTWDGSTAASAKFTCENNEEHTQTVNAEIAKSVEGTTATYTATVIFNGEEYTDTVTKEIHFGRMSVSDGKAKKGEQITLSVSLEENPGIAFLNFGISYDRTKLELVGKEDDGLTGWTVGIGAGEKAVWASEENSFCSGSVLKLTFNVLETAEEGETGITLTDVSAYNSEEEDVCFDVAAGTVTVSTRASGDVNGDGVVDGRDLIRLKQHFAGYDVIIDESNADANGDGTVDGRDVIRLAQYFAGYDVELK